MKSYDRQPKETAKAYRAFTRYRDQGPDRSLEKVASELNVNLSLIKKWSSQHEWVARVQDYDRDLELLERETLRAERKEFARRKQQLQLAIWEKMHNLIEEMSQHPLRRTTKIIPGVNGEPTQVIIEPAKWNFSTCVNLIKVWIDLGATIAGETKDPLESLRDLVNLGWLPASVLNEASLGLDELQNRIQQAFADLNQPIAPFTRFHSTQNENQDFGY